MTVSGFDQAYADCVSGEREPVTHAETIRNYLLVRQALPEIADVAARNMTTPLTVTKRGVLVDATRSRRHVEPVS